MDCPRCGLVSPDNATRCDCGYDFRSKKVQTPSCGGLWARDSLDELRDRIKDIPDEILKQELTAKPSDYVPGALELMEAELGRRGIARGIDPTQIDTRTTSCSTGKYPGVKVGIYWIVAICFYGYLKTNKGLISLVLTVVSLSIVIAFYVIFRKRFLKKFQPKESWPCSLLAAVL